MKPDYEDERGPKTPLLPQGCVIYAVAFLITLAIIFGLVTKCRASFDGWRESNRTHLALEERSWPAMGTIATPKPGPLLPFIWKDRDAIEDEIEASLPGGGDASDHGVEMVGKLWRVESMMQSHRFLGVEVVEVKRLGTGQKGYVIVDRWRDEREANLGR